MVSPKMIKDYDAASATVEMDEDGAVAVLSFLTLGPDRVFVSMRREAVERLAQQIVEARRSP